MADLHSAYAKRGLRILVFPCNQFGGQEPGTNADIKKYIIKKGGKDLEMFSKIDVNGNSAHPLYKFLKAKVKTRWGRERISWSYTKFLVNRNGIPIKRYSPRVDPVDCKQDIETALNQQ